MKKVFKVISFVWIFIVFLLLFSAAWMAYTWGELTMDEVLFQITSPLEGTSKGMLISFAVFCLLPAVVASVVSEIILNKIGKTKVYVITKSVISVLALFGVFLILNIKLDVVNWTISQNSESSLIDDNYVDPRTINIEFPEKKRNLIYIYLESMETTFSSRTYGGSFKDNYIPELTEIALENECFSGDSTVLNGGISLVGSTWTMGAIFSQSAALPLRIPIDGNLMSTQTSFFPALTALGDILEEAGYNQLFIAGSDATFGGRRSYFLEHGNFDIDDYLTAQSDGRLSETYKVWWGYEDDKLFEYAKQDILKLASDDKPFNCTILTADTHFEDGYVCEDCENTFGDNQYANVFACSSKKVAAFLDWLKKQDFYEDTTVVLCGDHPTMDKDFCKNVPYNDRKVYVAFINARPTRDASEGMRQYSTFDMFPTTLAALSVEIEGNKLGLGTNLYSGEATLLERYSRQYLNTELQKRTDIIKKLEVVDFYSDGIVSLSKQTIMKAVTISKNDNGDYVLKLANLDDNPFDVKRVAIKCLNREREQTKEFSVTDLGQEEYSMDLPGITDDNILCFDIYGEDIYYENIYEADFKYLSKHFTIEAYLDLLAELPDSYTILVAASDEASNGITPEITEKMFRLGFKTDLAGKFRYSYYGVKDGETVKEDVRIEKLVTTGILRDGVEYKVSSAGWDAGKGASITLNNVEYSTNARGLNFVIYDTERSAVVDSACFDTYSRSLKETIGEGISIGGTSGKLIVSASEELPVKITAVSIRQSEGDEVYYRADLSKNEEGKFTGKLSKDDRNNSSLHIDIEDSEGHYLKDVKIIDDIKLASTHFTVEEYLDALSEVPGSYSIIVAVSNEASYCLTSEMADKLYELGLRTSLIGKFRYSYYGIIDGDSVKEDISLEKITTSGTLRDGASYQVSSAGWDAGSGASIVINDKEYSTSSRGLNFVIYDTERSKVVDRVCFDTFSRSIKESIGEGISIGGSPEKLIISASEELPVKITAVSIRQSDGEEVYYSADLVKNDEGKFIGSLSKDDRNDSLLHIDIEDNEGHSLKDVKIVDDIKLESKHYTIEEYLDALSEVPGSYSVIVAVSNEASYCLTSEMADKLYGLGLRTSLIGKFRYSYYGIIDGDSVKEDISQEKITTSGTLRDGASYQVSSAGWNAGSGASIVINDKEYSLSSRGLNFVIYDTERSKVVDVASFDTYSESLKNSVGKGLSISCSSNKLTVLVSGDLPVKISRIKVKISDGSQVISSTDLNNKKGSFEGVLDTGLGEGSVLYIDAEDNDGHYIIDVMVIYDIGLIAAHSSIGDYLNALKEAPERYSILVAASDEASNGITDVISEKMMGLGFSTNLIGKYRYSYYGIIDGGSIKEEDSLEKLSVSGTLRDGAYYEVTSAGFDAGKGASIVIDGVQYSKNSRGLNFVIYDTGRSIVVDSVCFDTYQK